MFGLDEGAPDDRLDHAPTVALHGPSPRHAVQEGVVPEFQPGLTRAVGIDVAEHVGHRFAVVITARKLRLEDHAGHGPRRHLLLLHLVNPAQKQHKLLTRTIAHLSAKRGGRLPGQP